MGRATRRPGHHNRRREVPCPRSPLPALLPGYGVLRCSRDHLQLNHEVRCRHQEGPVRKHCHVRWHHHVPWYRRQDAKGDHCPGSLHHQDQDYRSPREEVLRLDRRLHPDFPLHLPADVDLQAGVRRVRPWHCPQEVLLSCRLENLTQSLEPNLIQLLFSVLPFFVIIEYNLSTVSMNKKFV